jgi:hypothetical protein
VPDLHRHGTSRFADPALDDRTLRNLTYSAQFAAPLAYTGLGFLLVMNRMVDSESLEWAQWVLFFALGGFLGNFILSLTDHAGNGFFNRLEWAPVIASALAVGFLAVPIVVRVSRSFLDLCGLVLLLEAFVGVWGFALHALASAGHPCIHSITFFTARHPWLLFYSLIWWFSASLRCGDCAPANWNLHFFSQVSSREVHV